MSKIIVLKIDGDTYIPLDKIASLNIKRVISFDMSRKELYELYCRTVDGQSHLIIGGCKNKTRLQEWIDKTMAQLGEYQTIDVVLQEEEIRELEIERESKLEEIKDDFESIKVEPSDKPNDVVLQEINPDELQKEIDEKFAANRKRGRKKKSEETVEG